MFVSITDSLNRSNKPLFGADRLAERRQKGSQQVQMKNWQEPPSSKSDTDSVWDVQMTATNPLKYLYEVGGGRASYSLAKAGKYIMGNYY